jgi:hypothetical protein
MALPRPVLPGIAHDACGVLAAMEGRGEAIAPRSLASIRHDAVANHGPETRDPIRGNVALAARGPF